MKFLAIGDSCTDVFIYGRCERICPEAPVPVFIPVKEKTNGGMSAM
jgi:bifunctional ADP-heptose synthase (sugar kinase/adenylyltransferase)